MTFRCIFEDSMTGLLHITKHKMLSLQRRYTPNTSDFRRHPWFAK